MSGAEKMVRVPLAELMTDPVNARKHNARNLEAIRASLRRFGQQHPLIVDRSGVVVAGNGRLEAMRAEGWEDCMVVYTELEGADRAAFAIADNRTAELADWEGEVLETALRALAEEDAELAEAAGFNDAELHTIIGSALSEDEIFKGLPEYEHEAQEGIAHIMVHIRTEKDLEAFSELMGQQFTTKTISCWWPRKEEIDAERGEEWIEG